MINIIAVRHNKEFINLIERAVDLLPKDVQKFLTKNNALFYIENRRGVIHGYTLSHKLFKKYKFLIYLPKCLFSYNDFYVINSIYHEIAHCYFGHDVTDDLKSYDKGEVMADSLAFKWYEEGHRIKYGKRFLGKMRKALEDMKRDMKEDERLERAKQN